MEKITNLRGKLLEGCVWDEKLQVLYFIDIEFRKIYQYHPGTETLMALEVPDYVGCIVPEPEGTLMAALPDGMYRVNFRQRTVSKAADCRLPWGFRYNDGKCDAAGRLWIGSMGIRQEEKTRGAGKLFCLERGYIRSVYDNYTIPNGLCWDKNGIFYHIDTPARRVEAYRVEGGIHLRKEKTAVNVETFEGVPDGMCIDDEGKLWIAMWGGSQVLRCDPVSGEIIECLKVPERNVSCCTFGGEDMDVLYITTARDEKGAGGEVYRHRTNTKGEIANRYGK